MSVRVPSPNFYGKSWLSRAVCDNFWCTDWRTGLGRLKILVTYQKKKVMRTKQTNQTETEVLVPGNRRVATGTPFKSRFNAPVYNVPFTEIWVPPSLPCTLKCGGDPEPLHLWWAELRARLWWLTVSACRVPGAQCLPADVWLCAWPSAASPWGLKKKNLYDVKALNGKCALTVACISSLPVSQVTALSSSSSSAPPGTYC